MSLNDVLKSGVNVELQRQNQAKTEGLAIANERLSIQKSKESISNYVEDALERKVSELEGEVDYYKGLLCKPMNEIAEKHYKFRETYEAQQQLMADWMVSQKAFKELAIQFGKEKGMTKSEVIKKGLDMEIDVLENKHDYEHNTNAEDSDTIMKSREPLIKKYHESRRK